MNILKTLEKGHLGQSSTRVAFDCHVNTYNNFIDKSLARVRKSTWVNTSPGSCKGALRLAKVGQLTGITLSALGNYLHFTG